MVKHALHRVCTYSVGSAQCSGCVVYGPSAMASIIGDRYFKSPLSSKNIPFLQLWLPQYENYRLLSVCKAWGCYAYE